MITVSLVHELQFIAASLGESLSCVFTVCGEEIGISVTTNLVKIVYLGEEIWREKIATADSNFGVESCTSIYQIMDEIKSGNKDWKSKYKHDFS